MGYAFVAAPTIWSLMRFFVVTSICAPALVDPSCFVDAEMMAGDMERVRKGRTRGGSEEEREVECREQGRQMIGRKGRSWEVRKKESEEMKKEERKGLRKDY